MHFARSCEVSFKREKFNIFRVSGQSVQCNNDEIPNAFCPVGLSWQSQLWLLLAKERHWCLIVSWCWHLVCINKLSVTCLQLSTTITTFRYFFMWNTEVWSLESDVSFPQLCSQRPSHAMISSAAWGKSVYGTPRWVAGGVQFVWSHAQKVARRRPCAPATTPHIPASAPWSRPLALWGFSWRLSI